MNWGGIQICPYFSTQTYNRIMCESISMKEDQRTAIEFKTEKEKKEWLKQYCERQEYIKCPYARLISQKYDILQETKDFIALGYDLRMIQKEKIYLNEGYKSFETYVKKKFGISRSTANRYITVNQNFSIGGFSRKIQDPYRKYSFSQLVELAGIPQEVRKIPPETTIKMIRKMKRRMKDENFSQKTKKRTEKS